MIPEGPEAGSRAPPGQKSAPSVALPRLLHPHPYRPPFSWHPKPKQTMSQSGPRPETALARSVPRRVLGGSVAAGPATATTGQPRSFAEHEFQTGWKDFHASSPAPPRRTRGNRTARRARSGARGTCGTAPPYEAAVHSVSAEAGLLAGGLRNTVRAPGDRSCPEQYDHSRVRFQTKGKPAMIESADGPLGPRPVSGRMAASGLGSRRTSVDGALVQGVLRTIPDPNHSEGA